MLLEAAEDLLHCFKHQNFINSFTSGVYFKHVFVDLSIISKPKKKLVRQKNKQVEKE